MSRPSCCDASQVRTAIMAVAFLVNWSSQTRACNRSCSSYIRLRSSHMIRRQNFQSREVASDIRAAILVEEPRLGNTEAVTFTTPSAVREVTAQRLAESADSGLRLALRQIDGLGRALLNQSADGLARSV